MTLRDVDFDIRGDLPERDDITRCLQMLMLTPEGTIPFDRSFGIDYGIFSYHPDIAKNMLAVELINKAEIYEPRAVITEVEFETDAEGAVRVKVVLDNE